jgi:sugar-specific transcriptional regulator TrmB
VDRTACTEALAALGFTALEAEVYAVLVEHAPATAYRVAQELGKAAANVYKAVESLERRGVVLVDGGDNRLCRAVAPDELLSSMQERFLGAKERARQALAQLSGASGDERVYQLRSREQVLSRAAALLEGAREMVLCDLFPQPAAELAPLLAATSRRGVRVCVQLYRSMKLDRRIHVFVKPTGAELMARWPGQWLNLVADAREHLLALLHSEGGGVHQAVWSESGYLSVLHHSGLSCEIVEGALGALIARWRPLAEIARAHARVNQLVRGAELSGYRAILARFRGEGAGAKGRASGDRGGAAPPHLPRRRGGLSPRGEASGKRR